MFNIEEMRKNLEVMIDSFKEIKKENLNDEDLEKLMSKISNGLCEEVEIITSFIVDFLNNTGDISELQRASIDIKIKEIEEYQAKNIDELLKGLKQTKTLILAADKDIGMDCFLPLMQVVFDKLSYIICLFDGSRYNLPLSTHIKQNPDIMILNKGQTC